MVSVRFNPEDEKIIRNYANSKNMKISEFIREASLEKIEEELDLKIVNEYLNKKESIEHYDANEVEKKLGL